MVVSTSLFKPDFSFEKKAKGIVCGIDEVGRGPLAGPVVAAAVILPFKTDQKILGLIDDSKRLTADKRRYLHERLTMLCPFGIGEASHEEIDEINILQATFLAMNRAVDALLKRFSEPVTLALIDGNRAPKAFPLPVTTIVKGDQRSLSIAAASIIAKHHRDELMKTLHETYPIYNWSQNSGYGTAQHREAISSIGLSPYHRKSFTLKLQKTATTY